MAAKKRCKDSCDHGSDAKFHGKSSGYVYHGCDCSTCLEWWRKDGRNRERKTPRFGCSINCIHIGNESWHGTVNGFSRHKCSCELCKDANNQSRRDRYSKKRQFIDSTKNKPCLDCGTNLPAYAMDYDHRDRSNKLFGIASYKTRSLIAIKKEIAKCDLVCANCHRVRTWPNPQVRAQRSKRHQAIANGKSNPCMDCGIQYPLCAMDYDHRDPSTKSFTISEINGHTLDEIIKEISKCDAVCANCHRVRTFKNSMM